MTDILVFVDIQDGTLRKASKECLSEAGRQAEAMGGAVDAVLVGENLADLAGSLGAYGVRKAYTADDAVFASYSNDGFAMAVAKAAKVSGCGYLFLPATARGKDLSGRVAARLDAGCAADVTGISCADGILTFTRPVFAGKAFSTLSGGSTPYLASLRPNVFPVDDSKGGSAEVAPLEHEVAADSLKSVVKSVEKSEGETVDVAEADIIVSGGRGLKEAENFALVRDLAQALGAGVGASRAVVDAGWIDHSHQVGQTGKTVSPSLYIAVGISGAVQHLAGMSSSKVIVAINKDPEAPIFKVADYGLVGDLFEIMPALTEEVKALKAQG